MSPVIELEGFGVKLCSLVEHDIELVRQWRNHPEIAKYMFDQKHISADQQQQWFQALAGQNDRCYLMISYNDEKIGVINGHSSDACILSRAKTIIPGLYLAPESRYKNTILAFSPSLVFIDFLYGQGCCSRLLAQVLPHNQSAIRYNEMLGYVKDSVAEDGTINMILTTANFDKAKIKLSKLLRF